MTNKINYGIGVLIIVLIAMYFVLDGVEKNNNQKVQVHLKPLTGQHKILQEDHSFEQQQGMELIANAYKNKLGNIQVRSIGRVVAILPDDNNGNRHQKFILELANGQTILVAHNIDLAPKIEQLEKGQMVEFFGEYEYSNKGGVIHWTHHDPNGRHIDGWLKYQGKLYR